MTDIYPQSPSDSAALLTQEHPLMDRVRELEQELQSARFVLEKSGERERRLEQELAIAQTKPDLGCEFYFRAQNAQSRKQLSAAMRTLKHALDHISLEDI